MNYSKAKIYVIKNHVNELVYVGSTCQTLSKRMAQHRVDSRKENKQNYKLYKSFIEIGIEHFYIEKYKDFPCLDCEELQREEGIIIKLLNSYTNGLNGKISGRTQKEYNKDNEEKVKANQTIISKKWYEDNKEAILLKQNVKVKCDICNIEINKCNLLRHKRSIHKD